MPATVGHTPVGPDSRRPAASTIADPPGIAAWRRFLEAHARVTRRLDDELQAAHGLSLAEYDALLQIAHAPGRRVRMNVLAERVILSRSGITRLVDRLEAAGLVNRVPDPVDRRIARVAATPKGVKLLHDGRRRRVASLAVSLRELPEKDRFALAKALPILEKVVRAN